MQKESVAVCKMTGSQAQTLQERDDVLRVEKDSTMKANGKRHKREVVKIKQSKLKKEWNMAMIRRDVNDTVSTKDKVKVAVIDSGVDFGNDVELKGFIDLVPGYEECLPYYTDITGHGSAVAGIIAAEKMEKVLQELIQMLNCIQQEYLMRIILHLQVVLLRPFIGQLTIM